MTPDLFTKSDIKGWKSISVFLFSLGGCTCIQLQFVFLFQSAQEISHLYFKNKLSSLHVDKGFLEKRINNLWWKQTNYTFFIIPVELGSVAMKANREFARASQNFCGGQFSWSVCVGVACFIRFYLLLFVVLIANIKLWSICRCLLSCVLFLLFSDSSFNYSFLRMSKMLVNSNNSNDFCLRLYSFLCLSSIDYHGFREVLLSVTTLYMTMVLEKFCFL